MDISKTSRRLKKLREEKGLTHKALAENLYSDFDFTISDKQLMYIEKGIDEFHVKSNAVAGMATKTLYVLAEYYNVSADYLLGFTDVKSPDMKIKEVCNYVGLSEEAVNWLVAEKNHKLPSHIISCINLLAKTSGFETLCRAIIRYLQSEQIKIRGSGDCISLFEMTEPNVRNQTEPLNYLYTLFGDSSNSMSISTQALDNSFWEKFFLMEVEKDLDEIKRELNQK